VTFSPYPPSAIDRAVFVNCPFDRDYKELFNALLFVVYDCGFFPACALRSSDSGEDRMFRIRELVGQCRYAIHDILRVTIDPNTQYPRFNMIFELGLYLGAKIEKSEKVCLVMDAEQTRYRAFCSDLAGYEIQAHNNDPAILVSVVRNWLSSNEDQHLIIPGGEYIFYRYRKFLCHMKERCEFLHLNPEAVIFRDYIVMVEGWLHEHPLRLDDFTPSETTSADDREAKVA